MQTHRAGKRRRLRVALASAGLLLSGLGPVHGSDDPAAGQSSSSEHGSDLTRLQIQKTFGGDSFLTCDLRELFRYTPVGGLQPGVLCGWQRGAEQQDTQLIVDAGFNLGTRGLSDGLLGVRWRRRSWSLAEVGVQIHALTDTSDEWRTDRLQSSLSFALQNRPDADYFRRSGLAAFVTAQPSPRAIVGLEYRLDDYASLASHDDLWILPSELEPVWRNPAIEAGRMGSLVLRAEWSSRPVAREQIRSVWRHPEVSLLAGSLHVDASARLFFRSWATLELARPALGADERLSFTRLVSEQRLDFVSGPLQGLRLRGRVSAAWGAPPQKEEGLGGWSAARGFAFNRYRGDFSLLGSAEYRRGRLAVFVDAGAVREPAGWSELLSGAGGRVYLWRGLNLGVAWRTTTAGRQLFPSTRILITDGW
jgi:hypothetical protein